MSYSIINSTSSSNFTSLEPFTPMAERTLSEFIFKSNSLQGDCKKFQSFAKDVCTLKDLEQKYVNGDIGPRDRSIAVAKCIALAILTTALFVILFSPFFMNPATLTAGKVLSCIFLGELGGATSAALLIFQSIITHEIFQRPSYEKVLSNLKQKNNEFKSPLDLERLKNVKVEVERQLEEELKKNEKEIKEAEALGAEDNLKGITDKKDRLMNALEEVSKMYDALLEGISKVK